MVLATACVVLAGCSANRTTVSSRQSADGSKSPVVIEVSNPRASLGSVTKNGQDYAVVNWSFTYHVSGQTLADEWYAVLVDAAGPQTLKTVRGSDLKPAGSLDGQALIQTAPPKSVVITIRRGKANSKGSFEANPVGGPVTVPLS
jgi:hypothetical protein